MYQNPSKFWLLIIFKSSFIEKKCKQGTYFEFDWYVWYSRIIRRISLLLFNVVMLLK